MIDGSTWRFGRYSDEQVAAVRSQGDREYAALVEAVDAALALVVRLEARPGSAKRDAALEILRAELGDAIRRLSEVGSIVDLRMTV